MVPSYGADSSTSLTATLGHKGNERQQVVQVNAEALSKLGPTFRVAPLCSCLSMGPDDVRETCKLRYVAYFEADM